MPLQLTEITKRRYSRMKPADLLDAARAKTQGTDSDIARALTLQRQTISDYRKGKRPIPDERVVDLALLAGLDPGLTLLKMKAHYADGRSREYWEGLAKRVLASVLAVALGFGLRPGTGKAEGDQQVTGFVYYVKSRIRGMWGGILKGIRRLMPFLACG